MIPSNTDLQQTVEAYQQMSDAELLSFAADEAFKLTTGAYLVLKKELQQRNIGAHVIREIEHDMIVRYGAQQQKFEQDIFKDLFIRSLEFALEAKRGGWSQYFIYAGLIERGITIPYANYMINRLDDWANALQRDALLEIQTGAAIIILGLVILYVSLTFQEFGIAGVGFLIAGVWRMLLFLNRKKKYKKIIDTMEREGLR